MGLMLGSGLAFFMHSSRDGRSEVWLAIVCLGVVVVGKCTRFRPRYKLVNRAIWSRFRKQRRRRCSFFIYSGDF